MLPSGVLTEENPLTENPAFKQIENSAAFRFSTKTILVISRTQYFIGQLSLTSRHDNLLLQKAKGKWLNKLLHGTFKQSFQCFNVSAFRAEHSL